MQAKSSGVNGKSREAGEKRQSSGVIVRIAASGLVCQAPSRGEFYSMREIDSVLFSRAELNSVVGPQTAVTIRTRKRAFWVVKRAKTALLTASEARQAKPAISFAHRSSPR